MHSMRAPYSEISASAVQSCSSTDKISKIVKIRLHRRIVDEFDVVARLLHTVSERLLKSERRDPIVLVPDDEDTPAGVMNYAAHMI